MSSLNGFESWDNLIFQSIVGGVESSMDLALVAAGCCEISLNEISIDEPVHDVFSASETSNDAV